MFGVYRTLLALAVVFHHLLSVPVIGHYAVHGFFILSGYLMTFIMHRTYGYTFVGRVSFAVNRFLRLYPAYWTILLLSTLAIFFVGESNAIAYRAYMYLPNSVYETAQNVSLLYVDVFPAAVKPRISPPTWALTIELFFYFLIGLGVSRSKRMTTGWFLLSVMYMLTTHLLGLGYAYRYGFLLAGSLPFSIGSMLYHYHGTLKRHVASVQITTSLISLAALFLLNSLAAHILESLKVYGVEWASIPFYANYAIHAAVIVVLIEGKMPRLSAAQDKKIGDYSYPLYLVHWQMGLVSSMLLWGRPIRGFNAKGILSLILALLLSFCLCFAIFRLVDEPVEKLRKKIKRKLAGRKPTD